MERIPISSRVLDLDRISRIAEIAASAIANFTLEQPRPIPVRIDSADVPRTISPSQRYQNPERSFGAVDPSKRRANNIWPL